MPFTATLSQRRGRAELARAGMTNLLLGLLLSVAVRSLRGSSIGVEKGREGPVQCAECWSVGMEGLW